ncbi:unnamed protein product [Prunus armeniaca]
MAWDLLYGEYHGGDQGSKARIILSLKRIGILRENHGNRKESLNRTTIHQITVLVHHNRQLKMLLNHSARCAPNFTLVSVDIRGSQNDLTVIGIGSLVIKTSAGKKYIREVMFLPGLKENLLSVG